MKAVAEPTAVEVRFDVEGELTPRSFTWRGASLTVEDVGRRWREGDKRCFNVLAAGSRCFELRLDEASLRWRVARVGRPRRPV